MKVSLSNDLTLYAIVQVSWYNVTSMTFFADQMIAKREERENGGRWERERESSVAFGLSVINGSLSPSRLPT